ncbi:MAG: hypothetical protein EP312_05485 [Gammaproteobacteria bacterium]|nr:MAG: hypothetical protein EP312_05485 [Gammaproteobacteria bacterium]
MNRLSVIGLLVVASVLCFAGWNILHFTVDDAYIFYRYAANSIQGYGYVWNPFPFLPVEGYSSLLWLVLLDVSWRVTGISPDITSHYWSLFFSYASLGLSAWILMRFPLKMQFEKLRLPLMWLLVFGLLLHRNFITWSSSGLETSMFNFLVLAWLFSGFLFQESYRVKHFIFMALCASAIYLSRPEGQLYLIATLVCSLVAFWLSKNRVFLLLLAAMILLAAVHLSWRFSFYGEWLPNTYYAKYTGPWPEAGVRYFASYVLENGLWWFLLLLALWWPRIIWDKTRKLAASYSGFGFRGVIDHYFKTSAISDSVLVTFIVCLCYYTLIVGGDVFEYRVYSASVPVVFFALLYLCNKFLSTKKSLIIIVFLHVFLALPFAWLHWWEARKIPPEIAANEDRAVLLEPVLPKGLKWYGRQLDSMQQWLIPRVICGRHHTQVHFTNYLLSMMPEREQYGTWNPEAIDVLPAQAVGVVGWMLPGVAIIDLLGLNDWVVARTPVKIGKKRHMAHDREAPIEYVMAFKPNMWMDFNHAEIRRVSRPGPPLKAEEVIIIEASWRQRQGLGKSEKVGD